MLWQRWQKERSAATRNALIVHYSPWARLVARDVYLRVYLLKDAWHDCVQNALLGLMEAIERFDAGRGVPFHPFARLRVRGAVFDGLRALRETHVELGHALKERHAATQERVDSLLEGTEGGDPLEAFIAATVGLGLGFLLDVQSMPGAVDPSDAYAELEKTQLSTAIAECVDQLPERDRAIIVRHYYHQQPFVEIASELGVTKGRVSQLHKRALQQLRNSLRERVLIEC
jgi:RNA polymerase sigma factor FliA